MSRRTTFGDGARENGSAAPPSRWKVAGDAIIAASRLHKAEVERFPDRPELLEFGQRPPTRGLVGGARPASKRGEPTSELDGGKTSAVAAPLDPAAAKRRAQLGAAALGAARRGDATQLGRILAADPAAADWADECSVRPLHLCASYGHVVCAEMLLGAGAKTDRVNVWGGTALVNAAHVARSA